MSIKENNNYKSVKSYWDELLNSPKDTSINLVNRVATDKYKKELDQNYDTTDIYFKSAHIPFQYSLLLNLFKREGSWIDYYNGKAIKIASKVRNYLNHHDEHNAENNSALLFTSCEALIGFAILACVEEFKNPSLPQKEILLEGLIPFNERLKNTTSRIPSEEKEMCILASVMALLSGEYELSANFLSYCKSMKKVKGHYSILNQITQILISKNKPSDDTKLEVSFFNIFNGYRYPGIRDKVDNLGDYLITNNLVSNYLFAWLYLKLFEEKTNSTWEEMRVIMMG